MTGPWLGHLSDALEGKTAGHCPSVYPPSADAPHGGSGWSGRVLCCLSAGHRGGVCWNSGIHWTTEEGLEAADRPESTPDDGGTGRTRAATGRGPAAAAAATPARSSCKCSMTGPCCARATPGGTRSADVLHSLWTGCGQACGV